MLRSVSVILHGYVSHRSCELCDMDNGDFFNYNPVDDRSTESTAKEERGDIRKSRLATVNVEDYS